jgi:predicted nucleotidyltransferase
MATTDTRTVDEIIAEITRRIVEQFDPLQVILFGSHARGDAHADSDVDLLVLPDVDDNRKMRVDIRRALSDLPVAKDIIVATPDELGRSADRLGSILRPAVREGRTLYERGVAA